MEIHNNMYTQDLKNNLSSVLFLYTKQSFNLLYVYSSRSNGEDDISLCVTEVVYASMIISFRELICFMTRYLGGRAVILFCNKFKQTKIDYLAFEKC